MFIFTDTNGYIVKLSFQKKQFNIEAKHVLIMVKKNEKWLCTINKKRGIEFPGGKVEQGETLVEAAIREVYEETCVHIKDVQWFAEYTVFDENPFCKAVFTAMVDKIDSFEEKHETMGVLWLTEDELLNHPNLSFYMQDEGLKKLLQEVKHFEREW